MQAMILARPREWSVGWCEMFDVNKPNRARQWFALGLMCLGWVVGRGLPPSYDVVAMVFVLHFFSLTMFWFFESDFILWKRNYYRYIYGGEPKQIEAEVAPRKIVDLNEKNNVWQNVALNVNQRDPRWQQFGVAVINGQPMTQSKWTGKGRPFSRPEFEKQIKKWLADVVIVHKKIKGKASSYRPNGAEGWQYFKALADGRAWLPLPSQESK